MTDLVPVRAFGPEDEPTLVYGTSPTAISVLGAALGARTQRPFGWVHCAPDDTDLALAARRWLEDGCAGNREFLSDPRALDLPEHRVRRLSRFFLEEPMTFSFEVRLVAYLGLPAIFQRMVSRVLSADGRSMVVLTNLDAVPPPVALDCFARDAVRSTLRREGVSLLATFRGAPPEQLRRGFPRVFRVDGPPGGPWGRATVVPEEGNHPTCGLVPQSTAAEWVTYLTADPVARATRVDPAARRRRAVRRSR